MIGGYVLSFLKAAFKYETPSLLEPSFSYKLCFYIFGSTFYRWPIKKALCEQKAMYINRKKYYQESQRSQYQSWILCHQKEFEETEFCFFIKRMYVRF